MVRVDDSGIIDTSGNQLATKMVCEHCVYAVEITDEDDGSNYIVCANTGPVNTLQLPQEFRCTQGRWFCREPQNPDLIRLISMDSIIRHRLESESELEILSPWF